MIERSRGIERIALLVAGSVGAGVHAGLAPEHLHEWLPLGIAFVASAAVLAAAVVVLAVRPDDTRPPPRLPFANPQGGTP
jgi:heme A synthase